MEKIIPKLQSVLFNGLLLMVLLCLSTLSVLAQITPKIVPGTFQGMSKNRQAAVTAIGLQQYYSATGKYTISADGKGSLGSSLSIRVNKPNAQATVAKAILISSVTFTIIDNGCVTIAGVPVNWDGTAATSFFNNYWADVTSIVGPIINGFPAGISTINITECNTSRIEGEALLVIFNDPTTAEKTIIVMLGAENPAGDNFSVTFGEPIDPKKAGTVLDMGLGIGYSYQQDGVDQASQVSVNGKRLTSSAGGEDDGDHANGALLTVGGIGDVNTNPADPNANPTDPRSDDELYSILPFISTPTTSLDIKTINPSLDDNIFLAYFVTSGAAIIGEGIVLSQTSSSGNTGTSHKVTAKVVNDNGVPITNRAVKFIVTAGPNAGKNGSANTNANGQASFTYTGSGGVGIDQIQACFTNSQGQQQCSNTLSFEWVVPTTPDVYYSKASGDLHKETTWGINPDGTGTNPPNFGAGKTFNLANRAGVYSMTGNWAVDGKLVNPSGSKLQINGFTLSIAELTGAGTLSGTSASKLIITGSSGGVQILNFTTGSNSLGNFTLNRTGSNASATLGTALNLYGVLTITNGTFNTDNKLTLKSQATTTAIVSTVTGVINGMATVEQYIPARRAWRLINAPVTGSQTIKQAWQENASSAPDNPSPGFGTHITGGSVYGTAANGFDINPLPLFKSESSLKNYNAASSSWQPIHNTNATLVGNTPFMLFVRGDRGSINRFDSTKPATVTVLRATGNLLSGEQNYTVGATGFTAVANPYQSPINFASLTRNNVQNLFYVWDPKLGGTYGKGAYVTVSWNGSSYDVTPAPVSPESQYIQPWQSFLVKSTGVAGTLTIKESDKVATITGNVFRTNGSATKTAFQQTLRVNLQVENDDHTWGVADEILASFNNGYSDKVDNMDVEKMPNFNENLAIVREGKDLAMERRGLLKRSDTLFLKITNTMEGSYRLLFVPANLGTSLPAFVEDMYQHTATPLNANGSTEMNFAVTADPASKNPTRFRIVFGASKMDNAFTLNQILAEVSPNPIRGGLVNVRLVNQPQGLYTVTLINSVGQVIAERKIQHAGGTAMQTIQAGSNLAKGVYQVRVARDKTNTTLSIVSE